MSDEWKLRWMSQGRSQQLEVAEKTLLAGVQEQRRARRWGIFFKLLTFIYLFGALALFSPALQLERQGCAGESYRGDQRARNDCR